jgi:hypothetical protein
LVSFKIARHIFLFQNRDNPSAASPTQIPVICHSAAALLRVACVEPDGTRIDAGKVLMYATRSVSRTIVNPTRFALRVRLALPSAVDADAAVWSFEPTEEVYLSPGASFPLTVTYRSTDAREHRWHECQLVATNSMTGDADLR